MSGYQSDINVQQTIINSESGGFAVTQGSANTYTITLETPLSSYQPGQTVQVLFHAANTGASTLDIDGNGALAIKKVVNGIATDVEAGDLNTVDIFEVVNNGIFLQVDIPSDPATIEQVRNGVNNRRYVTPYLLLTLLNSLEAAENAMGLVKLATQGEADAGTDDKKVISPLRLANVLNSLVASESFKGMIQIATQTEANTGTDDSKVITSLKLAGVLNSLIASEQYKGLVELATQTEVNTGMDDSKAITPLKLATVLNNTPAGELTSGLISLATQTEVNNGANATKAITPATLRTFLVSLSASESLRGMAEIATQLEVNVGSDDLRYITPLKLHNYLNQLIPSEFEKGLAEVAGQSAVNAGNSTNTMVTPHTLKGFMTTKVASQSEVDTGTSDSVFVTPLKLKSYSDGGEPGLGNPSSSGQILSSDSSGNRSWVEAPRFLFNHIGTVTEGTNPGTGEVEIPPSYSIPAGELKNNQGLRILINGHIEKSYVSTASTFKTIRIYIGNFVVLYNQNEASPFGPFQLEIVVYRFSGKILKGYGRLNVNDNRPDVQSIQTNFLSSMDSNATIIKMTAQNPLGGSGYSGSLINRFTFSVEKLLTPLTTVGSTVSDGDTSGGGTLPDPGGGGNPGGGDPGGGDQIDPGDDGEPLEFV